MSIKLFGPRWWPGMVLLVSVSIGCSHDDEHHHPPAVGAETGPVLQGADTDYEWAGYSVGFGGDVNGDGIADLLVSALASEVGGRVMVFYGPLDEARGADVTVQGEAVFWNLGESVTHSGGCDVDGDGYDDLLLGSMFADVVDVVTVPITSGDNRGKVYLLKGGPDLPSNFALSEAHAVFVGEDAHDGVGSTVACLGDLDADGFDDFAIAARRNGRGAARSGSVYLFYGGLDIAGERSVADADAIFVGSEAHEGVGTTVAVVNDIDGDGRMDIAISAPHADPSGPESGRLYLAYGQEERWSGTVLLDRRPSLLGDGARGRFGWSVDTAGDFNGDGVDDLIVGTFTAAENVSKDAWLILGGDRVQGEMPVTDRGIRFMAQGSADGALTTVSGLGDLDGDGRDEVLIGAPLASGTGANSGRVYIVEGHAEVGHHLELSAAASFQGNDGDLFADGLTPLSDQNGDNIPDFAASARGAGEARVQAGRVRIFFGIKN